MHDGIIGGMNFYKHQISILLVVGIGVTVAISLNEFRWGRFIFGVSWTLALAYLIWKKRRAE